MSSKALFVGISEHLKIQNFLILNECQNIINIILTTLNKVKLLLEHVPNIDKWQ